MRTLHYHVMAGEVGCLPDYNALRDTKRAALTDARDRARDYREAEEPISGSAEHGYAIGAWKGAYLEVTSCAMPCDAGDFD